MAFEDDELFDDIGEVDLGNPEDYTKEVRYIDNPANAVKIIANILSYNMSSNEKAINLIRDDIKSIFKKSSNICMNNEIEIYETFFHIIGRLNELNKYRLINDKAVVGVGGCFSSGKSRFISSIIGCKDMLPVGTNPTTSIPTYIIKGYEDRYIANNIFGSSSDLTKEQMHSISHEFYDEYKIGFAAFLENIVISSREWSLPEKVAILDTPGIEKPDNKADISLTDTTKALEQLVTADYLIWIMAIENGELNIQSIMFIKQLNIKKPILIVINKADKLNESDRIKIMEQVKQTVLKQKINCCGISVYSSKDNEEYMHCTFNNVKLRKGYTLIGHYIQHASHSASASSIMSELKENEDAFFQNIKKYSSEFDPDKLIDMINHASQVMSIRSLALLYKSAKTEQYSRDMLIQSVIRDFFRVNKSVEQLMEGFKNV